MGSARVVVPPSTGWSWVNQGTSTVDASSGAITITGQNTTAEAMRVYVRSAPSSPYTLTFLLGVMTSTNHAGICLRDSVGGKLKIVSIVNGASSNSSIMIANMNSATSFSGFVVNPIATEKPNPIWLQIADDGTNWVYRTSTDGKNWAVFFSEAKSGNFLTSADQYGFYTNGNSTSLYVQATLFSLSES
jgi:hypothetical protein